MDDGGFGRLVRAQSLGLRHRVGSPCHLGMTALCRSRVGSLVGLAVVGCFADPPGDDPTGSEGDSAGETTSVVTTDASGSDGASESASSSVDGGSSGGPCVPPDPACVEPGETIWEVLLGEAGNDAAFGLIVDEGGDVVVAGQYAAPGGSDPWLARFDADGEQKWSSANALGEGDDVLRGLALMGGGVVLAVGFQQLPTNVDAYIELRDAGGATVASTTWNGGDDDFLISVLRVDDFLYSVGFMQLGGAPEPTPLLLRHSSNGGAAPQLDYSSADIGVFAGAEGQLFGIAAAPNGNLVVVGALRGEASYDASVQILSTSGEALSEPSTFGGAEYEDFYLVDVDEAGSGIAVGRSISATGSEIFMLHFTIEGDTVTTQWEHAWTEAPFTYANGFARDGDTVFIATGTVTDPSVPEGYDAMILRWDGEASEPTWTVPFAADSPHRDYASDVELAPDGTLVGCGVYSPDDTDQGNAWVRKLAR